ncbi:MAG: flagellar export chaperone FliS [Pseudodesulfovibrio sp.]
MANPARAYLATQVGTNSQGELLIMLYEAAIKFLKRAKMEIEKKDYAKKGIYISKAMAIIHELSESLNKEKGGNITPTLLSLYQFCTSQLIKANIRMDTKRVDDVIKIIDGIRSAYAQIVPLEEGRSVPTNISSQAQAAQIQAAQAQAVQMQAEQEQEKSTAAKPQTKYGRPMPKAAYGMGGKPFAPASPQPTQAPVVPETPAPAPPAPAPQAQPAAPPAPPQQQAAPAPPQVLPEAAQPAPKPRSAFNAAKFRAANAYTNNS